MEYMVITMHITTPQMNGTVQSPNAVGGKLETVACAGKAVSQLQLKQSCPEAAKRFEMYALKSPMPHAMST